MMTKRLATIVAIGIILAALARVSVWAWFIPMAVNGPSLGLNPPSPLVQVGDIFTMDIVANTGTSTADTVDAYLDFDPAYLEVVDASGTPTTTIELNTDVFSSATFNSVITATGQINFSASKYTSPYLTGSFMAATIRFRAKTPTGSTPITFVRSGARWSDLYLFGESLNPTLANGTVTITPMTCPDFVEPPRVGVEDIGAVVNRWRLTAANADPDNDPNTPNYEAQYDVVYDGVIDIVDIATVAAHWGESCM